MVLTTEENPVIHIGRVSIHEGAILAVSHNMTHYLVLDTKATASLIFHKKAVSLNKPIYNTSHKRRCKLIVNHNSLFCVRSTPTSTEGSCSQA